MASSSDPSTYISSIWAPSLFSNTVVFCTGGNGTICSAQVRALVHLGADACVVGRNKDKTAAAAAEIAKVRKGSKVLGIGGVDVRRIADLEGAVKRCVDELGSIDFLIAGAAGNFLSPLSALSPNAFKSVIDIDLLGTFNTVFTVLPHLVHSVRNRPQSPHPTGRAIFISATFHYTGFPLQSHVAAAKAGVDALAASVAIEYGPLGVTCNVVSPGPIRDTEGMARLGRAVEESQGQVSEEQGAGVPLGRYGTVRDIADASVYLFSSAGDYVNGHVLVVDGGAWRTMGTGIKSGAAYGAAMRDAFEKAQKAKTKAKL